MSPLSVTPGLTQEATDRPNDQSTDTKPQITGPHDGRDSDGTLDHRYWRCENCGFESTDPALRTGCFRCGVPHEEHGGDDAE